MLNVSKIKVYLVLIIFCKTTSSYTMEDRQKGCFDRIKSRMAKFCKVVKNVNSSIYSSLPSKKKLLLLTLLFTQPANAAKVEFPQNCLDELCPHMLTEDNIKHINIITEHKCLEMNNSETALLCFLAMNNTELEFNPVLEWTRYYTSYNLGQYCNPGSTECCKLYQKSLAYIFQNHRSSKWQPDFGIIEQCALQNS